MRSRYRDGFIFDWNGAHTVNVWTTYPVRHSFRTSNRRLENIDCFSVGDFAKDRATDAEIERGINNWLRTREER